MPAFAGVGGPLPPGLGIGVEYCRGRGWAALASPGGVAAFTHGLTMGFWVDSGFILCESVG